MGRCKAAFVLCKNRLRLRLPIRRSEVNLAVDCEHSQQKYKHYQGEFKQSGVGFTLGGFELTL
jgi:hypothetical protein